MHLKLVLSISIDEPIQVVFDRFVDPSFDVRVDKNSRSVEMIDPADCAALTCLPALSKLTALRWVHLAGCAALTSVPPGLSATERRGRNALRDTTRHIICLTLDERLMDKERARADKLLSA